MAENKLRTREEVELALEKLGSWRLENCRWDREPGSPRYLAAHMRLGRVGAQSGPELVSAVERIENAVEELAEFGVQLNRGNVLSPTSSWWAGPVLAEDSSWANDLEDLLATLRVERLAEIRTAKKPKKAKAPKPTAAAAPTLLTAATVDVDAFAQRVLEAAEALPAAGRFGGTKVFIAHVWRALQSEWASREDFDAALVEANRTQRLTLVRADLVSAMDPSDVALSEVRSYGATWHFVVLQGVGHV